MKDPVFLLLTLLALVGLLWRLSSHPRWTFLFKIFPLPFWCYMVPTALTTVGWLPMENPLYPFLSRHLLPVCLVLLLIGTDLKSLIKIGPWAASLMLLGSLGTTLGGLGGFLLFKEKLPEGSWAGIGALSASWIGGSANLLAVKEALHIPDSLLGPLIIVDAVIAYTWMGILLWSSGFQDRWNRLLKTFHRGRGFRGTHEGIRQRPATGLPEAGVLRPCESHTLKGGLFLCIAIGVVVSLLAQRVGERLPALGGVLNPQGWTILLVTSISLGLSFTPLRQLEEVGISRIGTFALYILLASIGARADLRMITQVPTFFALGLVWILLHGAFLFSAGFLLKASLGLIATASQANIGGTISAPIVGATFSPPLASLGLLMAILGNILGTYLGILTALLARPMAG